VAVNVEPGTGEGGKVETTRLVTVTVGSLTMLGGGRVCGEELVSGGEEGEEESGGLGDKIVVGGKDEGSVVKRLDVAGEGVEEESGGLGDGVVVSGKDEESTVKEPGTDEGDGVSGRVRLEESIDVKDVREGVEMLVGVDVGIIVTFVEGCGREEGGRVELGFVIGDNGRVTEEEMLGEMEDTELGSIDEGGATEGDIEDDVLELNRETVGLEIEDRDNRELLGSTEDAGLETEDWDDRELFGSSEDAGNVVDRLLDRLEVELGGVGSLDVGVEGGEENIELE
jgi:hypothetical protein